MLMPDRIVREGLISSDVINRLDWPARWMYVGLILVHDDFGRFDARPSYLRARVYPGMIDRVREADVSRWLAACQSAGAIALYEIDAKPYGVVLKVRSKPRARHSKYPQPPQGILCWRGSGDSLDVCAQMRADDNICAHVRPNAHSNANANSNTISARAHPARASPQKPPAQLPFERSGDDSSRDDGSSRDGIRATAEAIAREVREAARPE
jgi:hypothetical protein